jgi:hypothetical protein
MGVFKTCADSGALIVDYGCLWFYKENRFGAVSWIPIEKVNRIAL